MLYNTVLHSLKDKVKNTTAFKPVSVGLHKYTRLLFSDIYFLRRKAVGFLEGEKFKYDVFAKKSDSPLYILLMCQSSVSLILGTGLSGALQGAVIDCKAKHGEIYI